MSNLPRGIIRGIEKIPGINLLQIAEFGEQQILMLPKVGTRSIRNSVGKFHCAQQHVAPDPEAVLKEAWKNIHYITRGQLWRKYNAPNTTIIVRSPLERLHSCWKQKVAAPENPHFFYLFQYYPILKAEMPFEDFLRGIAKIPVPLYEKHFMPLDHYLKGETGNFSYLPLGALNNKLMQICGEDSVGEAANTTPPLPISEAARTIFRTLLADRYEQEQALADKLAN